MMLASHSTAPLSVKLDPCPALHSAQSCSKIVAALSAAVRLHDDISRKAPAGLQDQCSIAPHLQDYDRSRNRAHSAFAGLQSCHGAAAGISHSCAQKTKRYFHRAI